MTVLPFRRPKKKKPKPQPAPQRASALNDPEHCPDCGWKLPATMSADPAHAGQRPGDTFVLYITCPDCDARLIVPVAFR